MVIPRMSIKFLGTSSMPNSTRNYSSLLFKLDNHTVMIDCGEGTQRQFRSRYVGVDERLANLKTILITHLHADHVLGLVPLLMSMMGPTGVSATPDITTPRIEIYGPPGLRALIRTTLSLCYAQLGGKYVVHEFVWPAHDQLPQGSPHALADQPERTIPDLPLHDGEASTGRNLDMDPSSFSWPNFLSLKAASSQGPSVRISAAPISHRCPTLAYVFQEEARAPPLDPSIAEALKRNGPALLEQRGIRHPLSLLSTLTAQRRSVHLPDGTVLDPPPLSLPGRKVTVMGDTSDGTGGFSEAQLRAGYGLPALAYDSDVLVHESTNIALPPHLSKNGKADSLEEVTTKAKSRGHSVPQVAGQFAALVNAKRLILNHFSTKFPSPPHYLLDTTGTNTESHGAQSESQEATQARQIGDPERKALIMKEFEVQAYQAWQQAESKATRLETYSAFDGFHFGVPARPEVDTSAPKSGSDVFARPWEQATAAENGNGLKRKHNKQGSSHIEEEKIWDPSPFLVPSQQKDVPRFAMVLLNSPIDSRQIGHFRRLWESASLRLCADGAANRLLDSFGAAAFDVKDGQSAVPLPNAIVGDLDSIRPDTRQFFESKGVTIHVRPSQYATDLQKSIKEVEDQEAASGDRHEHTLIIFGGLAGRLDQSVHTLHVLWQLAPGTKDLGSVMDPEGVNERGNRLKKRQRTFVVGDGSVAWLLPKGKHVLHISRQVMGKTCGILPLGVGDSGAKVTTKGLEWNLDGDSTTLGGFLSTSNHLYDEQGVVQVDNDEPVYWTVELRPDNDCST